MPAVAHLLIESFERNGQRPIVVASHPRSGTHLLIDTLRLNFSQCRTWKRYGESLDHLYLQLEKIDELGAAGALARVSHPTRPIIKTHYFADFSEACLEPSHPADPDLCNWLRKNATFLYTYRDGRDSLNSLCTMLRSQLPENMVLSEFIRQEEHGRSRAAGWAKHVQGWLEQSSVHAVAMEELIVAPQAIIAAIAEHCKLEREGEEFRLPKKNGSLLRSRLVRLTSRIPASSEIGPGVSKLPWQRLLNASDREFFESESGGRLITLGYEDSSDWTDVNNDGHAQHAAGFWNLFGCDFFSGSRNFIHM